MFIGIEAAHANKPDRTGVEEYCFQIIQELKKIIPSDVRVVLYTNKPLAGELKVLPPHWEEHILHWPLSKGWSQVRLALELFRRPPDLFFAPGQLVPFVCPKNTVTMVHDSSFIPFPAAYTFLARPYLKLMNRLVLFWSKVVITSTAFNQREMVTYYGKKIEPKIKVVPLAYNRELYRPLTPLSVAQEAWLKKITNDDPFILSVGRLEEKKNTRRIVEAFGLLRARHPESKLRLVLVGKPRVGFGGVAEAIEKSPFREGIIQPGYVWNDDLVLLYNRAEAFIFPSLYEGFGIPILEAMGSGCPVVTATGSALEEVGGIAALYVNPNKTEDITQALEKVVLNPLEKARLRTLGLKRAQEFSWGQTASATWKIFKEMVV